MKELKNVKTLVTAALLAAFTCIATMIIQIPTPIGGYIHLGDSLVILCGIILGPVLGAAAGGIGSMFADLLTGYFIPYGIPTLIIKALAAFFAGLVYHHAAKKLPFAARYLVSGIAAGIMVVIGYAVFEIVLYGFSSGVAAMFPNAIQACAGILVSFVLLPILSQVPDIRSMIHSHTKFA